MKNVVVSPNAHKDPEYFVTRRVISVLAKYGISAYVSEELKDLIGGENIYYYSNTFPEKAEAIVVVGGDGSVLDSAVDALAADIPLLGVNMGRLGYLTELDSHEIEDLSLLANDDFEIRECMVFDVTLVKDGEEISLVRRAVNDVVVSQGNSEGMSEIELTDGVGNRMKYIADGMIVATPLGSTAYSLAAGGPIVDSSLNAVCVTPICPHSLFNRSLLFPPEYTSTVKNVSRREGSLRMYLDGLQNYELYPGDVVKVTAASTRLKLISLKHRSVMGVLCSKMQLLNQYN